MATQGLVTVMNGDRVLMKVVAGNDGYRATVVAEQLRKCWPCSAQSAYDIALLAGFGSPKSLVVITKAEIISDELVSELYRATFQQPQFNPLWKHGTADHIEVIQTR